MGGTRGIGGCRVYEDKWMKLLENMIWCHRNVRVS